MNTNTSWLTADKTSGTGNSTIRITAAPNASTQQRTAILTGKTSHGKTALLRVTQEAAEKKILCFYNEDDGKYYDACNDGMWVDGCVNCGNCSNLTSEITAICPLGIDVEVWEEDGHVQCIASNCTGCGACDCIDPNCPIVFWYPLSGTPTV